MTCSNRASRALMLGFSALAVACSGGGSSGGSATPPISVSFASSGASVNEGAAPLTVGVVLHTSVGPTTSAITVDVVDAGGGTATSGIDYPAFAPQTLTFSAGSTDGTTQTVSLAATNDLSVEGANDTVRLGLANASGAPVHGTSQFVATLADIHRATIQFSSGASLTPDESNSPRSFAVSLSLPAGVTLATTASARVSDIGGGSAAAGADYAAFAPVTVTFAPGSPSGSTQTVTMQVLDDANVEVDETVRFGLASLATSTLVGSTSVHQLAIQDDDASGSPAFAATHGPNGTDASLSYDQVLDLGSQSVGAGSNTGTRLRVTNAGGAPMSLGAPRVTGANPNDFDVELETAPMPAALEPAPPGPDTLSPLLAHVTSSGPGVSVALDLAQLAVVGDLQSATLVGFPVPGLGEIALEVERVPLPIAADAVLRVDGVDQPGGLRTALGDLSIWSGRVRDLPGSHVFLALTSSGSRGVVDLGFAQDAIVHVVPDANAEVPGLPPGSRVVREAEMDAMGFGLASDMCSDALEVPGGTPVAQALSTASTPTTGLLATADCRLAIETDYQLYQKFGSTNGVTNYVTQLIAAVSDRYFQDVQTTLSIAYLGVYSSASDPWTSQDSGGNASALLDEFRAAWAPSAWPVSANLAHFVSGASLGGGIAYVGVLCNSSFGFGVSGNISGTVNWGSWTGASGGFTWDFVVVAHELGHNFGSQHTHAFCPPLDHCTTNCDSTTACTRGTIMSYCHVCGGMSNIDLEFHPVCSNVMRQSVNASCLGQSALGSSQYVQYRVRFNPLTNTGTRNADLEFPHDAPNATQPFRVKLQGTAN